MDADRRPLLLAQLAHTRTLMGNAIRLKMDLPDDRRDALKEALHLAHALANEFGGGPFVDNAALREYDQAALCPELVARLVLSPEG